VGDAFGHSIWFGFEPHTRARVRPAGEAWRVRFIFAPNLFIYLFNFSLILFDWIKV
jgi:hypothetical protein